MDAVNCIMTRRSIRKYKDKDVPEGIVTKLLECAMQAPSAMNEQPWEFIVVRDRGLLKKITLISKYAQMTAKAPLAVIICMNKKKESIFVKGYSVQDCSAATQNLLLAAHALGLGAVWTGLLEGDDKVPKIKELFSLPDHIVPLCIIPVGYPAEKIKPAKRFKKEKVHKNLW